MNTPLFVVLFDVESVGRQVIREVIGTAADILYLPDVEATARAEVLRRATVILAQNTAKELTPDELALIHQVRLLQFYTAGVDFMPLQALPADLPIAANRGCVRRTDGGACARPDPGGREAALVRAPSAGYRGLQSVYAEPHAGWPSLWPVRVRGDRRRHGAAHAGHGDADSRHQPAGPLRRTDRLDWHPGAARRVAPRGGRVGHRGSAHARRWGALARGSWPS